MTTNNISELAVSFQKSRVLLTAYELGIFTALGSSKRNSADIARAINTDSRATDRLMNALCSIGLLTKENGLFSNSAEAARYMVEGSPDYMANMAHVVNLWDTWTTLTEAVRRGTSVFRGDVGKRGDDWLKSFIAAMHYRATGMAPGLVPILDLTNVKKVLDVGGGSGAYSMEFVREKKEIEATVFDLPEVIPLTKKYVEDAGLSKKFHFVTGNCNKDELGRGFDLVFLSQLLHSNSSEENAVLIKKAAATLNSGGQVVVQEFIIDEDRTSPPFSAFFALNMLVATEHGDTYTEAEIKKWMENAGLKDIVRKDTSYQSAVLVGYKAVE